jgi:hypothetical protein
VSRGDFFRICSFVFGFGFSFFSFFFSWLCPLENRNPCFDASLFHSSELELHKWLSMHWNVAITRKKASHLPRGLSTVFGVFATQLPEF